MRIDLDTAFLDDGIRSTNFFNGRLLSAEDLTQEQQSRKEALKQFGRAVGEGVAHGLEVEAIVGGSSATDPVVTVKPGLAINREGRPLELLQEVNVALLRGAANTTSSTGGTGAFATCEPPGSAYVSGAGVYLLVISEAEGREGRASTSGLGGLPGTGCEAKRLVEGVRFRLLQLTLPDAAELGSDEAVRRLLRNRVAHHCFGTTDPSSKAFIRDPFGPAVEGYGLIDGLRPNALTSCDVPLAVLHWRHGEGLRWVDTWAARRRLTRPTLLGRWASGVADRRAAEGEAMFLQFQDQLEKLRQGTPQSVRAVDHFSYLPSVGLLPLEGGGRAGFVYAKFFEGVTARQPPLHVEGARLQSLLRLSMAYPPINVAGGDPGLWLYRVQENHAAENGTAGPQQYLVFTSGYLPYLGTPRFDAAHWSFANSALP
ncbi:hypothetical protein [Pyxidicoccus trucidator]|uniref:hypothetical protein n=1 Tax=Pyxidicoccus trucidator TaxID=2709662 RepID=UPI0013DA4E04|nr:hypothetical protein [Pyxidicoccus trucidator]